MKRKMILEKKSELADKLTRECPFRKDGSELENLGNQAINLQLSANTSDAKLNQCTAQLQNFNESVSRTAELKTKLDLSRTVDLTPEENAALQEEIKATQVAASAFNNLLQSGCEFKNGSSDIASIGNRFINILDTTAAVVSLNPANMLIATSAAISGRLVVSLSKWLFDHPSGNELLTKETISSKRFINDLCLFRTLAYKYDDLYIDPFEDPNQELLIRQVLKNKAATLTNELRSCTTQAPNDALNQLSSFSKDLASAVDGTVSQRQCLNLVNKYRTSLNNEDKGNHLQKLRMTYGCPMPEENSAPHIKAFCKNQVALNELTSGDIYEQCEDESFQKKIASKFTSLSDIIFQSVQESSKAVILVSAKPDDLQKLRDAEQNEKIAIQRHASLQAIMEDSPLTHVNSSKSMLALGRTILGDRFDDFTEQTIKASAKNLNGASKIIKGLPNKKIRADRENNPNERFKLQQEVCTLASQARQQLSIGYHSSVGIKDICHIMQVQGIPPLKSKGLNFDNYSSGNKKRFGVFKVETYLSTRCEKMEKQVDKHLDQINIQYKNLAALGCR